MAIHSTLFALAMACCVQSMPAQAAENPFSQGREAYAAGSYPVAAECFRKAAAVQPASGSLQNLGNAEWQAGNSGAAILAWERSLWVDPFNHASRGNLLFGRKAAQLESPELTWSEVVSTWLPANWWAWMLVGSFWLAVGSTLLPGIFRWRKSGWQQAVAALSLTVFLLSVPAQAGIYSRSRIGFLLEKQTPFRLTPTQSGQVLTRLQAGEPARLISRRGPDVLLRTPRGLGWVRQDQFALISH